ncbi:hypothetical protein [Chloroflexus sp.]|uniref:hypothetical protein n=1 Tax=Chloroflexus sp. TaxID=1904827 RepID=UPI00260B2406|nr:hypothetical protein [uncultured Chloroflexus sp.]
MATSYARARLTTEDDRRYRAYVEQFKLQRKNQKAIRPPRQRDIFGSQAEAALRDWLATQLPLDERRILEYEERRNRTAQIKYRELDALAIIDGVAWVFEIKASRTASALRRAVAQLNETRQILHLLFHRVGVTILLVDTGIPIDSAAADALMASDRPPPRRPEPLSEVLTALPQLQRIDDLATRSPDDNQVNLMLFSVDDIIALAGAENLALNWEEDDFDDETDVEPPPATSLFASSSDNDDSDDDNPLAAALRKAGLR